MLNAQLIAEVQHLHEGADRGYHNWSHPKALLALLPEVRDQLHDPFAVECAILFHDAIYEPTRTDNEQRSVALAKKMLAGVVPDDVLRRTVRLIEATQRHLVPDDLTAEETEDCRIFLDMDLSILGGDAVAFDRYEAGVRHEYRHVPETLFRQGRAAVLERFLARDPLYLSAWGRARFEAKGRENLRRSLRALREAPG